MLCINKILHTFTFKLCLDTGMQNNDEALLSLSLAGYGHLVKMPITLEPHVIFSFNFAFIYILRLSSVYQIAFNNNREQEKCLSKQSYFFINPKKPSK